MMTTRPTAKLRRGAGLAAVVIMMAAISLAVMGAISASSDEAQTGAMRAETARAFYAAESGARVALRCSTSGITMPAVNSTLSLGSASCTYQQLPASGATGDATIQGSDGSAARRLRITLSGS